MYERCLIESLQVTSSLFSYFRLFPLQAGCFILSSISPHYRQKQEEASHRGLYKPGSLALESHWFLMHFPTLGQALDTLAILKKDVLDLRLVTGELKGVSLDCRWASLSTIFPPPKNVFPYFCIRGSIKNVQVVCKCTKKRVQHKKSKGESILTVELLQQSAPLTLSDGFVTGAVCCHQLDKHTGVDELWRRAGHCWQLLTAH